jgi:hypothetical protein
MWEALSIAVGLVALVGLVWGLGRLLKSSQGDDHRYGNSDHWDSAGHHW